MLPARTVLYNATDQDRQMLPIYFANTRAYCTITKSGKNCISHMRLLVVKK
jgi:hypothetical protein